MSSKDTPEGLEAAIAAAPERIVRAGDTDPEVAATLALSERRGIVRLTTFNGSQIFIDFDKRRYFRAPKSTNLFGTDWRWNRYISLSDIQVGVPVRFDSISDWYRTSLVRYVDRIVDVAVPA